MAVSSVTATTPAAAQDDWERRHQIGSEFKQGIALLQEACARFPSQLVEQKSGEGETPFATNDVFGNATAETLATSLPKLNAKMQLIRGSPLLSARRNASLRNVAALAIAQPVSPRNVLRSGTPTPTPTPKAYGAVDVHRGRDALGIDIPDANVQMVSQGSLVNGDNNGGDDDDDDDDGDETLSVTEHILKPIETTADFLEWYGKVENQLAEDQDQEVHAYAELLRMRADQCSAMVDCIAEVEALLNKMELNYRRVCEQTDGVKTACSELQIKRDQLVKLSDEIAGQLSVYNSLNQIARLFNAPGDSICLDEEFLPSLERAEEAIRFIESHPSSQDSELYLMRFSQCRMRALTLIKMHALKGFKALSTEVSSEFSKDESSNKAAALYVRFRAAAVSLSPLLHTLHKRSKEAGSTERQILKDVQNAYFQVRRSWLRLYIQETLKSITKEQEEIVVELAAADDNGGGEQVDKAAMATDVRIGSLRDWCAFMMNVCADEYRLYYDFFDIRMDLPDNDSDDQDTDNAVAMSAELRGYLDSVMMVFHEQVRPQIIHESDVAVLAGISITLLTYRYAADNDNAAEAESLEAGQIDDTSAPRDSRSYFAEENGLDAFYAVVDQILQDAQQRLAYKAQSYIRTHISSYKVSKEDSDTISRWIVLCSQLQVTDPEDLEAIAAHASVTVDLQGDSASALNVPSLSRASSSFADVATAAATAEARSDPDDIGGNMEPDPVVSRLLERVPGGILSAEQVELLEWIYPPVKNYRWFVAQVDGCLDYEVQSDVVEEAQAACKQNLLSQGARFVRDLTMKASSSKAKSPLSEADAEHLAHLFVTNNLRRIEHVL